ncbi:cobalamin biosynthesis protein [Rhizosaccharibacter radicis]|uniref:Cobalamin biosynthesis protein n=1 Tax=Rhizosaccharibacter radicis TaxID=2782605 RepID=A0ABT1VY71_9PROT|nr:cobalamin biosynthesis protein [Acetobacteraceae bacterium KSS12]
MSTPPPSPPAIGSLGAGDGLDGVAIPEPGTRANAERRWYVGLGFRPGAETAALRAALRAALDAVAANGPGGDPPDRVVVAVPWFRDRHPALPAALSAFELEVEMVTEQALAAAQPRCSTRSARAVATVGIASVAEGCALAAAGATGKLWMPRRTADGVTWALAHVPGGVAPVGRG